MSHFKTDFLHRFGIDFCKQNDFNTTMIKSCDVVSIFKKQFPQYAKNPLSIFFFPLDKEGYKQMFILDEYYNEQFHIAYEGVEETITTTYETSNQFVLVVVREIHFLNMIMPKYGNQ